MENEISDFEKLIICKLYNDQIKKELLDKTDQLLQIKEQNEILNKNKKPDGQGGPISNFLGNVGNGIRDALSSTVNYTRPTGTYDIRGVKINDDDINEGSKILYGEISNRDPESQKFEVKNAINTAINRVKQDPDRYEGSITKALQEPAQYQSYAPNGIRSGKKIIESQYQKLQRNAPDINKKKIQTIMEALEGIKSGNFNDTTGGKTFYVHAADGTMWLGSTQKEAKDAANKHEKQIKTKPTNWKTVAGYPVGVTRDF